MTQLFDCPACGAALDYDGDFATVECPYCHNSVVVPAEIRQPAAAPARSNDFSSSTVETNTRVVRHIKLSSPQGRLILILMFVIIVIPVCIGFCATFIGILAPFLAILLAWLSGGQ